MAGAGIVQYLKNGGMRPTTITQQAHRLHQLHAIFIITPSSNTLPNSHQLDPNGNGPGDTTLAICTNKPLTMQDPGTGITWGHRAAPY